MVAGIHSRHVGKHSQGPVDALQWMDLPRPQQIHVTNEQYAFLGASTVILTAFTSHPRASDVVYVIFVKLVYDAFQLMGQTSPIFSPMLDPFLTDQTETHSNVHMIICHRYVCVCR